MIPVKRSASEWFEEAKRCYLERHQGCAWCGGSHRVHQARQGGKIAFECQRCDFLVAFDSQTGRIRIVPGEDLSEVADTMLGGPILAPAKS